MSFIRLFHGLQYLQAPKRDEFGRTTRLWIKENKSITIWHACIKTIQLRVDIS